MPLDSTPAPRSMPRALGCPPGASGCASWTPLCAPCPGALGCAPRTPLCAPCPEPWAVPPRSFGLCPWTPPPPRAPCPEPWAAPQEPRAVPPGLPAALHAREPRLRPGASPVPCSGCVLRSPACSPCRAGIAGVCSSMDETLGATGILGLRKRFTFLAPGSSPAPTRWVAPAPLFGLRPARTPGLLILRGAHPCFRRPACPSRSSCSRRRRAARASTAQTSAGGRGRVRRWAGPGPDGVCTARVHPRVHFEAEDNMQNITQHCLQ